MRPVFYPVFFFGLALVLDATGPAANAETGIGPNGTSGVAQSPSLNTAAANTYLWTQAVNGQYGTNFITNTWRAIGLYYRVIAEGYLDLSAVSLERAVAAQEQITTERLYFFNQLLTADVERLSRLDRQESAEQKKIELATQRLGKFKNGKVGPELFSALAYFFANFLSPDQLWNLLEANVEDLRGAENFIAASVQRPVVDFASNHIGAFLMFLKANQFGIQRASPAHRVILHFLDNLEIAIAAEAKVRSRFIADSRNAAIAAWR